MAGRPREFDRDEALAQIQSAFWDHGYEGTSLADLVAVTGLASARLYAAFGPKEQMFRAAIDLYVGTIGAFADRAFAEESTLFEALQRMFEDAIDVYTTPHNRGCMVVSAATACSREHASIRRLLEDHRSARSLAIVSAITSAPSGQLPQKWSSEALSDFVATVLNGLSVQARDGVPIERLRRGVTPLLDLFAEPRL